MAKPKNKQAAQAQAVFAAIYEARNNPYVKRVLEDEELRDTIRAAFTSAQDAYKRVQKAKAPQKVVIDDKKFHKDLRKAAEALKEAGSSLREDSKKSGSHRLSKAVIVIGLLALAALALSSDLREKVLDLLFGAEEEFDYMSTTSAPVSSPESGATQ